MIDSNKPIRRKSGVLARFICSDIKGHESIVVAERNGDSEVVRCMSPAHFVEFYENVPKSYTFTRWIAVWQNLQFPDDFRTLSYPNKPTNTEDGAWKLWAVRKFEYKLNEGEGCE